MKFNPKISLKVVGKMNSKDTGIVGKMLASAAIIAASSAVIYSIAEIITAMKM